MTDSGNEIRAIPVPGIGELRAGDDVCALLLQALSRAGLTLANGDVLVVKHKIISKAEGRVVSLEAVRPSRHAAEWAARYKLDARVVELALRESERIVRQEKGVLITQTRHGLVCANSGVDLSNVDGGHSAVLLPEDPDRSAASLRRQIEKRLRLSLAVIISDSFGRPWREGLCEAAIGIAGLLPLHDYRGQHDPYGYELHASVEAVADELACAAGLVCGKLAATPACIIRGFRFAPGEGRATQLVRPASRDLFR
ncbi:MAG TPA: coenzyme F420-0:L-glutamate ligase [Terriglobales bacterium]|nr:coenzyme F420-0:L-glutamate ligase [Terriglobales bacterium]